MPAIADLRARGFSLIELLVALAVFGLVVLALLNLSGQSARSAWQVEEQVLAGIVAENAAVEAMLSPADALAAPVQGEELLGDRRWRWSRSGAVQDAGPGLLRIDIRVAAEGEDRVAAQRQLFRSPR